MIHKFSGQGIYVVLDVHSGAVHLMDPVAYAMVEDAETMTDAQMLEKYGDGRETADALKELRDLQRQGMLFTPDIYEDVLPQVENRNPVVKALCLHVAHDCNLKCKYCFAEEGEYHGKRSLMSEEVGKAALDFLLTHSGSRKNLEVDFFGGEPLMNFEVVKKLVDYGRTREKEFGKHFRFTITTNGILLNDDVIDYINETMDNVVLSLDGRREVNDHMRPKAGGQGSYDTILPKFQKLVAQRSPEKSHYLRGTYTHHNLDFDRDVIHMADCGFTEISVEPVVAPPEEDYALREEDLPALYEAYDRLSQALSGRKDINFFHFQIDLTGGPCVAKRLAGCGSGTEYLAVTPEGDLYPCHQFVGMPDFKMGTVWDGVTALDTRAEFDRCNLYTKDECRNCWAKFYCSGGCAANAYNCSGSIFGTYPIGCALQKKRVECAILLKALEALED